MTGNGLAEVVRNDAGGLVGFAFLPWHLVTLVQLPSGRLAYDVTGANGAKRRLLAGEVLHLRDRTDDGLVGRSRLARAADAVGRGGPRQPARRARSWRAARRRPA